MRWLLWLGCALVPFSCGARGAHADGGGAMKVVVRVCSPRDRLALERLRGQTSDLPVDVLAREGDAMEPSLAEQLRRAQQLAAELDAVAVVWFDDGVVASGGAAEPRGAVREGDGEPGLLVYVATPGDGRVLARRLTAATAVPAGPREEVARAQAASALLEQSALVVRFALRGLAQGGALGVEGGTLAAAPAGAATTRGAPPTSAASETRPRSESRSQPEPAPAPDTGAEAQLEAGTAEPTAEAQAARLRPLGLALGYELTADGFASSGEHALCARASWSAADWDAALVASLAAPAERLADLAGMRLQRTRLAAALAAHWDAGAGFRLAAGGGAGVLLQRRTTIGLSPPSTARAPRTSAAFVLGPELHACGRWGAFGLVAGAGLDVLPSPTRFVLRDGQQEIAGRQPWRVQPRAFVAAELSP